MNGKFDKQGFDLNGQMLDDLTDVIDQYDADVCLAIPTADGDGCLECYVPNKIAALFKGTMNYTTGSSVDDIEARTKQLEDWLRKVMTNNEAMKKLGYDNPEDYPEVYLERLGRFEAANGHYDMDFETDEDEEMHKREVRNKYPEGYFSFYIYAYKDPNQITGEWCDPFWNI